MVPSGTFPSIRLLMLGMDGDLELRRTIGFSPGTGIVREEKTRYRRGKSDFQRDSGTVKNDHGQRLTPQTKKARPL
jgi:hypothetical protein